MYATIQRWGNSQGLRIPKALLDALGLRENDRVELIQSGRRPLCSCPAWGSKSR